MSGRRFHTRYRILIRPIILLTIFATFIACGNSLHAELKIPSILSDHMVLQRDQPVPIWGWDTPGKTVSVTIGDLTLKDNADDQGNWKVAIPPHKAGGPHEITISGTSTIKFSDVLFGEVWLCSGQSNMEWRVNGSLNSKEEIASANHPQIRHIKIPHTPSDKPQSNVASPGWQVCSPQTVASFTAVGYFFGRNLQSQLNVPIGLIGSNWGGTRIEPWTPPSGFQSVAALKSISDQLETFPAKNAKGQINHQSPLALYNGMIHPLLPYRIRGALWYQGESNNGEGMLYFEKMKALIQGWRNAWNQPQMPFYFVQLAPYRYGRRDPTHLAGIWEAQLKTLDIPNTGMAVTTDIGNVKNIHPQNKQEVGRRLAIWALAKTYNKPIAVYSGPLYQGMKSEGNKIRLLFKHTGSGLVARDGKALNWFTIAGADKKFVEAKAVIDGDSVVVSSDEVAKPLAVRFGWNDTAEPNLSNKEGLPASPFRTDSW